MALFQPSNITPSSFAGIGGGVVDVSDPVSISWQVNGNSGLLRINIKIYTNDAASTLVHTFTTVLDHPFYGTAADGSIRMFVYEPGGTWADAGLTDGNSYKMKIDQSYPEGGSLIDVAHTSPAVFVTRTAPTLSVSPAAGTLTSVNQTFTGTYAQAQYDGVTWVRWVLSDGDGNVLDDTGEIYTPVLSYTYNGFFTGESYSLSCTVETSSGAVKTVTNAYTCSYATASSAGDINTECNPDDSVTLTWSAGVNIPGVPSANDYGTISDGVLHLAASRSVTWNQVDGESMSFSSPYAFSWRGVIGKHTTSSQTVSSGTWEQTGSGQQVGYTNETKVFNDMFPNPNGGYYGSMATSFDPSVGILRDVTVISSTGTETEVRVYSDNQYSILAYSDTSSPVTVVLRISYYYDAPAYRSVVTGTLAGAISGTVTSTTASGGATVAVDKGSYTVTMYHSSAVSRTATVSFTVESVEEHATLFTLGTLTVSNDSSWFTVDFGNGNTRGLRIPAFSHTAVLWVTPTTMTASYYDDAGKSLYSTFSMTTYPLPAISSVVLSGAQDCDYLFVTSDTSYGFSKGVQPTWNGDTLFFAQFASDLQGGTVSDSGSAAVAIYRREGTKLTPLGAFVSSVNTVRDYGIRSNGEYEYILYYISSGAYSAGMTSGEVCKQFRQFTLIEAVQDADDGSVYHPLSVWRFRNNIESGAVSNGNTPSLLDNFTKYPYWQPSSPAPKSGTLTALLSYFSEGEYIRETAEDMERLYALSQTVNPLFLRDMKGNLYMVRLSGPISQTVNYKTGVMEVTVSVPWIEVGDADGVKILSVGG